MTTGTDHGGLPAGSAPRPGLDARAVVRRAGPDDAEELAQVFWRARNESVPEIPMIVHPRESVLPFVRDVLLREFEVWVAVADDHIVGFVAVMAPDHLGHLYLLREHTGQGVGAQLVAMAKQRFPAGLQLWAFQSNVGAIRFYEREGFVPVEWTEGENEEQAPDVRMVWRPAVAATVAAYTSQARDYAAGVDARVDVLGPVRQRYAARLGPGAQVLEVGSGPGRDALGLEALGLRVRRTDISPGFVELLRERGYEADVLDPLRDDLGGPYDGVWASACLLHVPRGDLPTVLRRLHRATRPGGAFYLDVKEGDGEGWSTHGALTSARHFTFWREPDLRAVLAAAGWTVDTVERTVGRGGQPWLSVLAHR